MNQPQAATAATAPPSLEQQREEYGRRRFLAMPLAGMMAWSLIGVVGWLGSPYQAAMTLYFGAGSIFYLGVFISRFTGEHLLAKNKPKSEFDKLFISTVLMSLLVFAIALPWAAQDYRSAPLSIGILTGLMWLPFGWVIQHWIGAFHAIARTLAIVAAWYLFPDQVFVVIPAIIVSLYIVSITVLEQRWRRVNGRTAIKRATQASCETA